MEKKIRLQLERIKPTISRKIVNKDYIVSESLNLTHCRRSPQIPMDPFKGLDATNLEEEKGSFALFPSSHETHNFFGALIDRDSFTVG